MGRSPCCHSDGLKKGPWTTDEDAILVHYIQIHGPGNWRTLPKNAGLERCGKSCRLRWTNYLRPDIKRGSFTCEEEDTIIQLHSVLGNKWSTIAARLPGRTDNEIKNYWNTHIRKRLLKMGIDPVTHAPRFNLMDLSSLLTSPQALNLSNILRLQTLLNPDALRLAILSLVSKNESQPLVNPGPLLQPNLLFENTTTQQTPSNLTTSSFLTTTQSNEGFPAGSTDPIGQLFRDIITTTVTASGRILSTDYSQPSLSFSEGVRVDISENSSGSDSAGHSLGFDSTPDMYSAAAPLSMGSGIVNESESFDSDGLLRFEIPEGFDFDELIM